MKQLDVMTMIVTYAPDYVARSLVKAYNELARTMTTRFLDMQITTTGEKVFGMLIYEYDDVYEETAENTPTASPTPRRATEEYESASGTFRTFWRL